MKIHEVMSVKIVKVTPKTPLRDLWKAIFKQHLHALPVVDTSNKLLGMVAEEDLLKPLYPNYQQFIEDFVSASDFEDMEEKMHDIVKLKAEHVMNRTVIFTRADTPILRALSRMIVRDVRQLPVLSDRDELIGVVSKGDIFDSLFRKHLTGKILHHRDRHREGHKSKRFSKARTY